MNGVDASDLTHQTLPPALRHELAALYRELDDQVQALGVGCWARGDCCNFERQEHLLYATTTEIAYVRQKHPELSAGTPPSKLCPFWTNGRCTERERRPLGCRVFHCDRRYRETLEALYERYHKRLLCLTKEHGLACEYVPFVRALRKVFEPQVGPSPSTSPIRQRGTTDVEGA